MITRLHETLGGTMQWRRWGAGLTGMVMVVMSTAGLIAAEGLGATPAAASVCGPPAHLVTFPVEAQYGAPGPASVTTRNVVDSTGKVVYVLTYPADLGDGRLRHPIITWGNGSLATPSQYPGLLHQLASWGFVVVASTSSTTGKGHEMLAGARYLVAENQRRNSIFFHRLDGRKIGAIGHSQGAGGAVNATNLSGGLIKTTVAVSLPNEVWVSPGDEYDVSKLTNPVLFLGGSTDVFIAPPAILRGFYDRVPGPAAMAVLTGGGHNTIQGTGGGYLGYVTAWMMYQLRHDRVAKTAFVANPPEINANPLWQDQAEKHLTHRVCPTP